MNTEVDFCVHVIMEVECYVHQESGIRNLYYPGEPIAMGYIRTYSTCKYLLMYIHTYVRMYNSIYY